MTSGRMREKSRTSGAAPRVFVVAMPCEAACVTAHLQDCRVQTLFGRTVAEGYLDGRPTAVVTAGVGKTNAAAAAQLALAHYSPPLLYNIGVAGGLLPTMQIGEIYPVAQAVEYDFDLSEINGTEPGTLNEYRTPYLELSVDPQDRPQAATLATGDHFTDNPAEHAFLGRFHAGLRDMEGAAIVHVCQTAGVACRMWKCVSDVAGRPEMTRQYKENRDRCLEILTDAVPGLHYV